MTAINGGNFWNGFAAGALSSIAASAFSADFNGSKNAGMGWAGNFRESGAGMIAAVYGADIGKGALNGAIFGGLAAGISATFQARSLVYALTMSAVR